MQVNVPVISDCSGISDLNLKYELFLGIGAVRQNLLGSPSGDEIKVRASRFDGSSWEQHESEVLTCA